MPSTSTPARAALLALGLALTLAGGACGSRTHRVQFRVTGGPYDPRCVAVVRSLVAGGPEASTDTRALPWQSPVYDVPGNRSVSLVASVATSVPGPPIRECTAPITCEIVVDGATARREQALQHTTCTLRVAP